jgi:hydrogenase maturation protein HypF
MANPVQLEAVAAAELRRLRVVVRGAVQGVGFRPFVFRLAQDLGLAGWVLNSAAGVFIEVESDEPQLRDFIRRLETEKPAIASVQSLEATYLDPVRYADFEIRESAGGEKTALILPDTATCPDCLREINDPSNRRYRYPFTNCTNCGPRFSIIAALPYDRPRTTMAKFTMCADCAREYADPNDRRFHAQPNACPTCGPHVEFWDLSGAVLAKHDAALRAAADAIRRGEIVAVKGLGGFHLMVDARNDHAVRELRIRKHREEKPLALMFPNASEVLRYCTMSDVESRLLQSIESPIVLLPRRMPDGGLSPAIAPGNPYLGAMLPYTPLHHLLMADLGFPVIATSGNLSEEPICTDEREALARLRTIVDCFLVHDRPILHHADDSVVREMGGRELLLRRARGFAPLPVYVEHELPTLLAVGAHQKNTIALSVGKQAFVSQHIGDLETEAAYDAFRSVIGDFQEMYEATPAAIACDLHPDYMSTQFARSAGAATVSVQHHYAHVLSCMAENHLRAPVLGIAWDGSGFGPDETVWGGEFLRVDDTGYQRVAHLRTFRLPGGERAVREPRRVALALLYEIFGDEAFSLDLPCVHEFSIGERAVLAAMLRNGVNSPVASSAGRLFDAIAALLGIRQVARFEGQAAIELEAAAAGADEAGSYPFSIHEQGGALVLDWEPMVRGLLAEREPETARAAARFHNTLVDMGVEVATRIGEPRVVLSGGCFQNRYLTERFVSGLQGAGFQPYWHQRVPPNDGGIALGQLVAAARERRL